MIVNLKQAFRLRDESAVSELDVMESSGCKAEIEALYLLAGLDTFSETVAGTLQEICADQSGTPDGTS